MFHILLCFGFPQIRKHQNEEEKHVLSPWAHFCFFLLNLAANYIDFCLQEFCLQECLYLFLCTRTPFTGSFANSFYYPFRMWSKTTPYYNPIFIFKKVLELFTHSLKGYLSSPFHLLKESDNNDILIPSDLITFSYLCDFFHLIFFI